MHDYAIIGVFVLVGIVFVMIAINVSNALSHQSPSIAKGRVYECGVDPVGSPWVQFRVSYYIYALLFVIFDIEVLFLFPWAVVFSQMGPIVLVQMAVFIGVLLLGLVYAWKEGALTWR